MATNSVFQQHGTVCTRLISRNYAILASKPSAAPGFNPTLTANILLNHSPSIDVVPISKPKEANGFKLFTLLNGLDHGSGTCNREIHEHRTTQSSRDNVARCSMKLCSRSTGEYRKTWIRKTALVEVTPSSTWYGLIPAGRFLPNTQGA